MLSALDFSITPMRRSNGPSDGGIRNAHGTALVARIFQDVVGD
jgi:hypothetical protein